MINPEVFLMNIKQASIVTTIVMLLAVVFCATNSSAIPFDAIYTVGSNGSTTMQDTFSLNETPWLYLELPQTGQNITWSWWTGPDNDCSNNPLCFVSTGTNNDADGKIWLSLPDWDSIKDIGEWTIEANSTSPPCCLVEGTTSFKVSVPEPSTVLLLLTAGAGFVGLLSFRNKKQ
ncbi:MAG: PEP-CTERM sorting domain-containing protein [Nitrospirae bacterium]|nr:PEP-CTERM sorting domain-containing protein [Nitrospirota bacterium]